MATIAIKEIEGDRDLDEVAAFRYEVYVEEMGRVQKYANEALKRVLEPLDHCGRITAAYDEDGKIVGTLRTNYLSEGDIGDYRKFYRIDEFGDPFEEHMTITTKLMVRSDLRSGSLPLRMAMEAYRVGIGRGVVMDFIDCNRHLEGFFHKLGYRAYCGRRSHAEYGDVLPMVLYSRDWLHLSVVGSPFLKEARKVLSVEPSKIDHRRIEPWIERGAA
jgi:hypothetical protein